MKRARESLTASIEDDKTLSINLFNSVLFNTSILNVLQRHLDTLDVFCLSGITRHMYYDWMAHRDRADALCLRNRLHAFRWNPPEDCKTEYLYFWVRSRSLAFISQPETKRLLPCWWCNIGGHSMYVSRLVFPRQTCGKCAWKYFVRSDKWIYPSTGFVGEGRTGSTVQDVHSFKGCVLVELIRDYACRYYKMTRRTYYQLGIDASKVWMRKAIPFYQSEQLIAIYVVPAKFVQDTVWAYMERRAREACERGSH